MMGHRDDFYVVKNIIGITGDVHDLPSVYFRTATEYGHITQFHSMHWNWGRTPVIHDPGWEIVNICPAACGCNKKVAHEINGKGEFFHGSRNPFKPYATLTAAEQSVIAEAIYRCPLTKTDPFYDAVRSRSKEMLSVKDLRYVSQKLSELQWAQRHERGPGGRRGAIDYTNEGLANRLLAEVPRPPVEK